MSKESRFLPRILRTKPELVGLTLDAGGYGAMHACGFLVWQADDGVWLTDAVHPDYPGF